LTFKLNQHRHHHIPRQTHKVTNWPAYEASLRQCGSLTVWLSNEAIAAWAAEPRTTRGGQPWYSALAILTALTLRAVSASLNAKPRACSALLSACSAWRYVCRITQRFPAGQRHWMCRGRNGPVPVRVTASPSPCR